ncbi:MAG: hypothetical protein AAFN74_27395, partial [Myxococcota bacterium]
GRSVSMDSQKLEHGYYTTPNSGQGLSARAVCFYAPRPSDVSLRVHAAVKHALDDHLVIGEGVEGDVFANDL